jgi:hypothetical protein
VSFNLQIKVAQKVGSAYWRTIYGQWYLDPMQLSSFNPDNGTSSWVSSIVDAYDYYSGNATIGVKRIFFASVGEDTFAIDPPAVSSLILGATATSVALQDLSKQWNPRPTGGANPYPANSGYGEGTGTTAYSGIIGGPYYARSRSTVSLIGEFGGYKIASDTGIDFITPTVFVRTARFWLEQ